nr:MAG TPA: hypothetical protein [Caudoviricetes sp.]
MRRSLVSRMKLNTRLPLCVGKASGLTWCEPNLKHRRGEWVDGNSL